MQKENIKIAIHNRNGSYSDKWLEYCERNSIPHAIVNCFQNDIINTLKIENATHLMWHYHHNSYKDLMVAPYVLNAAKRLGIKVYPNYNTRWHFDDKIAQKYLLESINAPLVPSRVSYSKEESLQIIKNIDYPIVAKLKRGAGSTNVRLLKNRKEAHNYVVEMFHKGINPTGKVFDNFDQKKRLAKEIENPVHLVSKIIKHVKKNYLERKLEDLEKGYFYYQEFMPNNEYDTRVVIIGEKGIAFKRYNRKGDFRASGSGLSSFDDIDPEFIKIAFEVSKKLSLQSVAFDFIYNEEGDPKIIELSYAFGTKLSSQAPGYWDSELNFNSYKIDLKEEIIKEFI